MEENKNTVQKKDSDKLFRAKNQIMPRSTLNRKWR
jgi:hypothetical protein